MTSSGPGPGPGRPRCCCCASARPVSLTAHFFSVGFAGENQEHYSFLIPVVKALVEKLSAPLCVPQYCLDIPSTAGHVFFEEFQSYSQGGQWRQFVDQKVGQAVAPWARGAVGPWTATEDTFGAPRRKRPGHLLHQ